jgi:hypothetical protein
LIEAYRQFAGVNLPPFDETVLLRLRRKPIALKPMSKR